MNRSTPRSLRSRLLRAAAAGALGAALLLPNAPAFAQTGPPPPAVDVVIAPVPGTPTVEAQIQSVAPPGIPPLTAEGVIAVIPETAVPGTQSVVTTDLGGGTRLTLLVPADATRRIVRVQGISASTLALPMQAPLAATAAAFMIDLYDATTGAQVRPFPTIIAGGLRLPTEVDPAAQVVFRFDEAAGAIELAPSAPQPESRILQFDANGPGYFFVGAAAQ